MILILTSGSRDKIYVLRKKNNLRKIANVFLHEVP